jgi:hypothetical protein
MMMQSIAKRCYHRARRSAVLRRVVGLPVVRDWAAAVIRRVAPPPGDYAAWVADRRVARGALYPRSSEPGLLSFVTTVWNTKLEFLGPAVDTLLKDQTVRNFEWVVLDNGSTDPDVCRYLRERVAADPRVRFLRVDENLGIVGGMRHAVEHATGRYVLPYDSDDTLEPDAVSVLTHYVRKHGYPPILYTDEDKTLGGRRVEPFLKPDWDPVLFVNACYIAHLGCFDRAEALRLGVYTDRRCEGCHDWDTFTRFVLAGHRPVHVAEVLYSWRMHPASTAGNIRSKSYIHDSQRALLERIVASVPHGERYEVRHSPLFNGTPDWWLFRHPVDPVPLLTLVVSRDPSRADTARVARSCQYPGHEVCAVSEQGPPEDALPLLAGRQGLVGVVFEDVVAENPHWPWEALALTEIHPDTVMVGGRVLNADGVTTDGGRYLGFGGAFGCPDRLRPDFDPGYSAWCWKQRSVSGVSARFCVVRADFLRALLEHVRGRRASWYFLGAYAAALALRTGQRVVYTPLLAGRSDRELDPLVPQSERDAFVRDNRDLLPDARYYSPHLSLRPEAPFVPVQQSDREAMEDQLIGPRRAAPSHRR